MKENERCVDAVFLRYNVGEWGSSKYLIGLRGSRLAAPMPEENIALHLVLHRHLFSVVRVSIS